MKLKIEIDLPEWFEEKVSDEDEAIHTAKYIFRLGIRRKNKKERFWGEIYLYK